MSEATTTAYQLKNEHSVIVKAKQFNPHEHPWPDGVISWDGKPRPRDMSWGYIELPQKREHVFTGDYIVLDRLGKPYPVRSALFEDAYRPVIAIGLGDTEALKFVSNVIELKPNKKYLLIFKGLNNMYQLDQINKYLRAEGFDCACISTPDDQDVQVIEAPSGEVTAKKNPFWIDTPESENAV